MATSVNANALASGDTAYLYRAAIGPRAQDYYLRHFARFDADGSASSSWNWAAYCCTFNWLVYRRMWGRALAYVGVLAALTLLIFGAGKLLVGYSDATATLLFLLLLSGAFVLPGMYANAWYYTFLNQKVSEALRSHKDMKEAATALSADAPDGRRLMKTALTNAALLALAVGVASWFDGRDGALQQLAASREEALSARPVTTPVTASATVSNTSTSVVSAAAPAASSSAAVAAAPESAPAASSAVEAPRLAQAASAPAVVVSSVAPPAEGSPAASPANPQPGMALAVERVERKPIAPTGKTPAVVAVVAAAENESALSAATPPPAATAATASRAPAPRVRHVWVIQVGAYAQETNASQALAQVQGLGLEAGTEAFESPQGQLTRVRVGPFTRLSEARQAEQRIKAMNLPVLLIRQAP